MKERDRREGGRDIGREREIERVKERGRWKEKE
jgi:hypothetical protein